MLGLGLGLAHLVT